MATVGRKRLNGKGLPRHVVVSKGWLFHKHPQTGKWTKLAKDGDLVEMHRRLSELLAGEAAGTMLPIFERYEREILPTKSPKTKKVQEPQMRRLKALFGSMDPASITRRDIQRYLKSREAKVAADREMALLSHVFTTAMGVDWELATFNPCLGVKRNNQDPDVTLPDDLSVMLTWLAAKPHVRAYMAVAYVTGLRPGDVVKLKTTDADHKGLVVQMNKTKRKGKRVQPLLLLWTPNLRAAWNYAIEQRPVTPIGRYLFCNSKGVPYTVRAIQEAWKDMKPAVVKAGGEPFPLKNLRNKSGSEHITGDHLGHSDPRVKDKHYRLAPRIVTPL